MKSTYPTSPFARKSYGFTIVEVVIAVGLAAVFVAIFATAISAYQEIRYDTTRRADAYAIAKELAYVHRGTTTDGISCASTSRQVVAENLDVTTDPDSPNAVRGNVADLINPRYDILVQYLNGCDSVMRIIIVLHYGPGEKRDTVEGMVI